jgi:hypothetical protein
VLSDDPKVMTEEEIRTILERIVGVLGKSQTWVTGEVEFETRSGDRISGRLKYLEPASAIIDGPRGMEAVLIRNIIDIEVRMESPGPE